MSKIYPKFSPADSEITCFEDPPVLEGEKKIEMTQAQIDAIVNGRSAQAVAAQRKAEDTAKQALLQLESLKGSVTMTDDVKTQYEQQLEELNKRVLTTEQLKAQELGKQEKVYKDKLEAAEAGEKKWKAAHDDLLIDSGIEQAAITHEAEIGTIPLFKAYLKPQTRLVPEKDDQGNIRKYVPTIDFHDIDAKGAPTVVTLPVAAVVAKMKEKPEYFPLFKGTAKSGVGGSNGSGGSKGEDPNTMTTEQYVAWNKRTGQW